MTNPNDNNKVDIQKYIASGILEQYVLGQLSPTERREVEQYAVQYPEIRTELDAIEEALELYGQLNAVQPSANLEGKILDRIRSQAAPAPRPETPLEKPVQNRGFVHILGILGLAAALAAAAWGWSQKQEVEAKQTELDTLQAQMDTLRTDCDRRLGRLQAAGQAVAFLRDGSTTPVQMAGTAKAPEALATVFWNPERKKSYLDIGNMPALPTDKQYQLWAIVDGAPVDMGVFDLVVDEATGLVEVPFIETPQAFAVTLEPRGGSAVPTLEEMYVVGNTG